ncbi:EamA-like transporter family protein [Falsochrobactrum ovis]|uniref:EamA-like transporter family protein n=1 Tax=Falsochrobactrum ovis TaxID=1293442 RepID=A0A364JY98_9HYPH|nr:DMT family transporter [Falsochrobactrum ovis]RAK33688.1 EamA-like transporter family protein [Falsochrobactrum ovis]
MKIMDSPLFLLLGTGIFLGLVLPLGKIAAEAGIPAVLWAFLVSASAGTILWSGLLLSKKRIGFSGGRLRYYLVTAFISYALPNLLMLSAIPRLGAGYTGIMYTLSPVLTLLISVGFGLRRPNRLGVAGIVVGFVGAIMVAFTRGEVGKPAEPLWIAAALLLPLLLAIGNVYRTIDWPKDADPTELAAGSHLVAALMILAGVLLFSAEFPIYKLADIPAVTIAQAISSAGMFALFFRLQVVGGPIYLSQISYVAAALGLLSGIMFLGESYPPMTLAGAGFIAVGVGMTTRAQRG